MKIINVIQGSAEWKALRARHNPASEAPAIMGTSAKVKRNDLLHMKATGSEQQFSRWVEEVLFQRGHDVEERARPIAEKIIGEDLYRVVATDDEGYLLASFDGITMAEDCGAEIKQWNESKAKHVRECGAPPPEDLPQVVQHLAVSGASRWLYMVSDGTEAKLVYCWVERDESQIKELYACWRQFDADVAAYKPTAPEVVVEGRAPESLPALHIEARGMVTASNLDAFKASAMAVLAGINRDLQTDADFADAEKTVKWCKGVEDRLETTKAAVLAQMADVDLVCRTMDDISAETRRVRLELDRLVKLEKEQRRAEAVRDGIVLVREHYATLNASLGEHAIGVPAALPSDIGTAIKGLKTLASIRNAIDTAVAKAKIDASQQAELRRQNAALLAEHQEHAHLFVDRVTLCATKQPEDLRNLIAARITEHKAKEAAERKASDPPPALDSPPVNVVSVNDPAIASTATKPDESVVAVVPAPATPAPTGRLIKLGDINARLAPLKLDASGLAALGFQPAGTERSATLYRESDFNAICAAIIDRVQKARGMRYAA